MIKDVTCTSCGFNKVYEKPVEVFSNCPKCGSKSQHIKYNPKSVGKKDFVNVAYPELERYSRSMGVPPADIKKYQKMYPGSEYNSNGDLRIKNYTHREYERKRRGMVDLGNRR